MRIAIVTHNVVKGDGQGRVNYEIARFALTQGATVSLLSDHADPYLLELGARWIPLHPYAHRINLLKVREFVWLADRALDRLGVQMDIVHGNGVVLNRHHHVNTAHFVHGAWLRSPVHTARLRWDGYGAYHWLYSLLNSRWERRVFGQAGIVVAVSGKIRQELIDIGIAERVVRVIRNGVDPQEFRPGSGDRMALGLPAGVTLALFAGDIRTPLKNLETVLKALLQVPELHLAVAGATAGSPYPRLATRMGLADRVHFLQYRQDLAAVMRAVDMFVLPSRFDSSSLVLLEAMASGLPAVTAATVGSSELITPECGIVLADPDDAQALARALTGLLGNPDLRRRMGTVARSVAEQHTWADMARNYMDLYNEIIR